MSDPNMRRCSPERFMAHLSKWWFVTGVKEELPLSNTAGRYHQMVYYSLAGILGGKEIADRKNPIAVVQHAPGHTRYFINENAKS